MTLVAMACGSPLEEGVLEQVEYLINEKGADCTIPDVHGNTPVSKATQSSVSMATLQYVNYGIVCFHSNTPVSKATELFVSMATLQ